MLMIKETSSVLMLICVVSVFYIRSPLFLSRENIEILLEIIPELGIATVGVTMLMISGEFDLSVGSVFALSAILMLMVASKWNGWLAVVLPLLLCCGIGALNGIVTLRFRIPSFITTLGSMFIWRGVMLLITGGWPPPFSEKIPTSLFVGYIGFVRSSLIWFLAIVFILYIVLEWSVFGNWIFATGGNREAARSVGINTNWVKLANFILCSFLAGFAGMIQGCRVETALPVFGTGLELETIAGSVIGGSLLVGGMGTVVGSAIGTFLVRIIDNGLILARVPGYWFRVFIGIVMIMAVILNIFIRERVWRIR